jgi:hypothetical protein
MSQTAAMCCAFVSAMVIKVMDRLPQHCGLVTFVDVTRTSGTRGQKMQFALDAVAFGMGMGLKFGLRNRHWIVASMTLAHDCLLC